MSPQPSAAAARPQLAPQIAEYSVEERLLLLQLAHDAIAAQLQGRELDITPPSPHLAAQRGAFTTLHLKGELRGCVGYVFPMYSLFRTVSETAVAAAFHDTRFWPVTPAELPLLKVEISVLSPLRKVLPENVEVGRDGLVITFGARRGLLLPQVPVEQGWDRETFLQQTCIKAGCPPDAWFHGAVIEAFTAEVFGEI